VGFQESTNGEGEGVNEAGGISEMVRVSARRHSGPKVPIGVRKEGGSTSIGRGQEARAFLTGLQKPCFLLTTCKRVGIPSAPIIPLFLHVSLESLVLVDRHDRQPAHVPQTPCTPRPKSLAPQPRIKQRLLSVRRPLDDLGDIVSPDLDHCTGCHHGHRRRRRHRRSVWVVVASARAG